MKLTNEFNPIRDWADARGIYTKGDVKTQFVKLMEEVGELGKAILKNDRIEFNDAIGDCVVVLTNLVELSNSDINSIEYFEDVVGDGGTKEALCEYGNITLEDCVNLAFKVIAERTGKMQNGTFVKDK
jgi:hypothetical protein